MLPCPSNNTCNQPPLQCGKMDQACAFGATPVLMTYDGDVLSVAPARLGAPLHLVLVDLRAGKDTVQILAGLQVRAGGLAAHELAASVWEMG